MEIDIRRAGAGDLAAVAAIYNQGIAERRSTFETEPRTAAHLRPWLDLPVPLLVASHDGEVVGWARVAPYSARPCYAGVGEASVYVSARTRGYGVGKALTARLEAEASGAGFHKLLGKLFPENHASRRLVERCGFREVGIHLRHGRMDGEWRDVVLVELLLGDTALAPGAEQ